MIDLFLRCQAFILGNICAEFFLDKIWPFLKGSIKSFLTGLGR